MWTTSILVEAQPEEVKEMIQNRKMIRKVPCQLNENPLLDNQLSLSWITF